MQSTEVCEIIGQFAVKSLLYEVSASPKPGLVDRFNQGAHTDMDFFSFMSSSAALPFYFYNCALHGVEFDGDNLKELFDVLRPAGMDAEKAMYKATGGINTHKGLIFSLGIICACSAWCWFKNKGELPCAEVICEKVSMMAEGICSRELASMNRTEGLTSGEMLYKKFGFKGIRGEVENGFPTVRNYSLPVLKKLKAMNKYHINDILVQTLLHLISVNEDTNILARKGIETLDFVKKYSSSVLEKGGMLTPQGIKMIYEMDREFINLNVSPGGSADLLAVTVMLDLLDGLK